MIEKGIDLREYFQSKMTIYKIPYSTEYAQFHH
jgi:hypothetical protein